MSIGWPQGIYLVLTLLTLGLALGKHGEPKGEWDFWATLFNTAVAVSLLYWGGFFG